MDIRQMIDFHLRKKADMTISALPVSIDEASAFGVIQVEEKQRVIGFQEKPRNPLSIPGRPDEAYASMGNYIFSTDFLLKILYEDAEIAKSTHDFGKDIVPRVYKDSRVFAYDFRSNKVPGASRREVGAWRDVGTIQAYWEANMDLRNVKPVFNLYNNKWPIKTTQYGGPPAKFVFNEDGRRGQAINSIVAEGSIISGGIVQDSVIGREVLIDSGATVINSMIMDRVQVGKNCQINMAIIDKDVIIPHDTSIGYNLEEDRKRFHVDEESNIIVISKGYRFADNGK
jgi:glucose-1-phosphate adenylyltransferase